jgi:hypothetical protein
MARRLAAALPGRRIRVVADSAYAGGELKALPVGVSWTTRLRKDAADLMVRTGMRLTEQASLTALEVPVSAGKGCYQKFWLPAAVAKNASARWVYNPGSVTRDLAACAEFDRAGVVADARDVGRYRKMRRPLVIDDQERPDLTWSKHRDRGQYARRQHRHSQADADLPPVGARVGEHPPDAAALQPLPGH